jgi:hypothetical protein
MVSSQFRRRRVTPRSVYNCVAGARLAAVMQEGVTIQALPSLLREIRRSVSRDAAS